VIVRSGSIDTGRKGRFAIRTTRALIDRAERTGKDASDHATVIVELRN